MPDSYAVSEEQTRQLQTAVSDLAVETDAVAVILSDREGHVLAHTDIPEGVDLQTICALAAGSFAATRQFAVLLGEPGFHAIYHQGERISTYIHCAADTFLVIVLFDRRTTVGLVKLYVGRQAEELTPQLRQVARQSVRLAGGDGAEFELDPEQEPFEALVPT
jgi:predicted regulator of Ras-like GTPase activity (Roadblock/LC7/MglB family)